MTNQTTAQQCGITREAVQSVFGEFPRSAHDNWKLSCPFHGPERTPSFFIHKTSLICHCFGCGIAGPVDVLAARYLEVSKEKAREQLGITGDVLFNSVKRREQSANPSTFPESWLAQWKRIRNHPYCASRQFEESTLIEFDARWDSELKRVVFPLRDRSGRLYGASGRTVVDAYPKWHFYWNCNKGQDVFCNPRYEASSPLIVVEGLFDLLWLHQHAIYNVCSLNGSTATRLQIRSLRTLSSEFILGLDNDDAGRSGELKLFKALRKSSIVLFQAWPSDANDWMDLSEPAANPITAMQRYQ